MNSKRLKISIHKDDMKKLALYPAPTYIVGIDDITVLPGF